MQTVPYGVTEVKYTIEVSIISRASARSSLSGTVQGRPLIRRLQKALTSQRGTLAPLRITKRWRQIQPKYIKGLAIQHITDSPTFDHRMAWHRCYHPIKQPNCVPCSTPLERLYCCRHVSLIEGDIFQSPFSVAHCVSADQALKKGLAREIKRWYPLSWVVRAQDWSVGKVVIEIIHVSVPW